MPPTLEALLQPKTPDSKIIRRIKTLDDSNNQAFESIKDRCLEMGVLLTELKERCRLNNKNWTDEFPKFGFRFQVREAQRYMLSARPENQAVVAALPPDTGIRGMLSAIKPNKGTSETKTTRVSHLEDDVIDAEEVDYKQLYEEALARIAELEAEVAQLKQEKGEPSGLSRVQLATRLGVSEGAIRQAERLHANSPEKLASWFRERDPEGLAWVTIGETVSGKPSKYVPYRTHLRS